MMLGHFHFYSVLASVDGIVHSVNNRSENALVVLPWNGTQEAL
jgi:hypothetical protein